MVTLAVVGALFAFLALMLIALYSTVCCVEKVQCMHVSLLLLLYVFSQESKMYECFIVLVSIILIVI